MAVDDLPITAAEIEAPFTVDAGRHEVVVQAPGFLAQQRRIELVEGQHLELSISLAAVPEPLDLAPSEHVCSLAGAQTIAEARRSQTTAFVAASVGAALLGAGAVLYLFEHPRWRRSRSSSRSTVQVGLTSRQAWIGAAW